MKALPLTYRGTIFRSRLEADWACTLDHIGIAWDYEPEGFELSDGVWYSPDFYLPEINVWMEVKGPHMQRMDKVQQFAVDLWGGERRDLLDRRTPLVVTAHEPRNKPLLVEGRLYHEYVGLDEQLHAVSGMPNPDPDIDFWYPTVRRCSTCDCTYIADFNSGCRRCGDRSVLDYNPTLGYGNPCWKRAPRPTPHGERVS